MNSEFIHVSEFYQSIIAFTILTFSILLLVSFCLDLFVLLQKEQIKQYEEECIWNKKNQQIRVQKEVQQKMLQESVNIQIQNQITNMQKNQTELKQIKPNQFKQQQQKSQRKSVGELDKKIVNIQETKAKQMIVISQRKIKFSKFVIALNEFMSQNLAILMPIIIIGILTKSTYVFTLAAFFCALFCSIIFDFLRLQQQIKEQYKKGIVVRRLLKLLSSLIIMSLLCSYWIVNQFNF